MGYVLKKGTKSDSVVYFPRQRKRIELEKATQKEMKLLFEMKHPFIELVK